MTKKKEDKQECFSCENGIEKTNAFERDCMLKYGWYAHFVFDDPDTPNGANIHTHGLEQTFNHKDIQLCMPLRPEVAHSLLVNAVEALRDGKITKYSPGVKYKDILSDPYVVQFIEATECGRPVLRMVLPDKNNQFDTLPYSSQFTKLDH